MFYVYPEAKICSLIIFLSCIFFAIRATHGIPENTNYKQHYKTTCYVESKTFSWTIERFTFISSMGLLQSPTYTFCYNESLNITKCANYHVVVEKLVEKDYLDVDFVREEMNNEIWINARLYDYQGSEVRKNWMWKNYLKSKFRFNWHGTPVTSYQVLDQTLSALPQNILVIKWDMMRIDPTKDILTE